jgi:hypothetical protein
MGMNEAPALSPAVEPAAGRASLADALFTATQQRILGLLFGQPERSFYANELIALTGSGSGAVQRELARLAASGLVVVRLIGRQKHYQANPDSPIFAELCGIASKTIGLAEPLRLALAPLVPRIRAAFVYGSVARRQDTVRSDGFVKRVLAQPRIRLIGSDDALAQPCPTLTGWSRPVCCTPKRPWPMSSPGCCVRAWRA